MSKNSNRALVSQLLEWLPTTKKGKATLERVENKSAGKGFNRNKNSYGKNRN